MSVYRVLARDPHGHRTYVHVVAGSILEALENVPDSITAHHEYYA